MVTGANGLTGVIVQKHVVKDQRIEQENVIILNPCLEEEVVKEVLQMLIFAKTENVLVRKVAISTKTTPQQMVLGSPRPVAIINTR